MDNEKITTREVKMRKANALSVCRKLLTGICAILMVGIAAYGLLFLLMLII